MSVASSLSSIAEKLASVLSKINTKLVEKGATEAATLNDVDSKLDEISTGNISVEGSFQVVAVDGAAYGFEKQADEYWKSTNKGISDSCSVCKVVFNMSTDGTAVFDCINYAEASYDYGVIGNVDTELSITNIDDTSSNIAKSFKDSSSSNAQTYSMVISSGEHFVYVKYRKDGSKDENDDVFKFKVSIASSAATSADILYGKKAYVNGALIEGTIQTKTGQQGSTITSNGTTSIPQGYHDGGSYVSVNVSTTTPNGALDTPSISFNSNSGQFTATSKVKTSGYISTSETKTASYTISTYLGGEYTPTKASQTISTAGYYCTGDVVIKGDSNLVPANIKNGTSIFGVQGTYAGGTLNKQYRVTSATPTFGNTDNGAMCCVIENGTCAITPAYLLLYADPESWTSLSSWSDRLIIAAYHDVAEGLTYVLYCTPNGILTTGQYAFSRGADRGYYERNGGYVSWGFRDDEYSTANGNAKYKLIYMS